MLRIRLIVVMLLVLAALGLRATPTFAATTIQDCPTTETALSTDIANVGSGGTVTLSCPGNTTIYFDTANGHNGNGGPITISQSVTLDASNSPGFITLDGGHTAQGGGVQLFTVNQGATLGLSHLTLQNGSSAYGGAIYNVGTVTISSSTLANNSGDKAGAIWNGGAASITSSTLANNSAIDGGAIHNVGTVSITNSTLSGNSTTSGGAISNSGTMSIGGSIIANNTAGGNCHNSSSITDQGYNLTDSNGLFDTAGTCGLTGSTDLTSTNPQLGPLQDNGGPTPTMALQPSSLAIDRIPTSNTSLCPTSGTDQRGHPRPDDSEGLCEIGAYESVYATPPICPTSEQDLIQEISLAGSGGTVTLSCPGATTIYFDTANGHTGSGGPITINSNVTLDASSSPATITLDGGHTAQGGGVQLFHVNAGETLKLSHLTLQNGYSSNGGAIDNEYGWVNITNSTLSGNSASSGGAIYNPGNVSITNSTLSGNSASSGGGAIWSSSTLTITNSTLSGNSASGGSIEAGGGAISNQGTRNNFTGVILSGNVSITNSTLSGNSSGLGGAINNNTGAVSITNSTLSGDTDQYDFSGAFFSEYGYVTIGGSIIANSGYRSCYVFNAFPGEPSPTFDLGYNLTDDQGGKCGLNNSTDVTNTDPLLGPLQDNGGPTKTMAPASFSPAVDQIPTSDSSLCPASGSDQRGQTRPDDNEGTCDIGAYESTYANRATTLSSVSGSGTYGGSATFTATLTSGSTKVSGQTISFTLNGTAVCGGSTGVSCPTTNSSGVATLSNVSLTGIDVGDYAEAVGASFAGDTVYGSSAGTGGLTVGIASQSITFGPVPNHTYGDAPFTIGATASSGLPVSFSVLSTDQCTIAGSTVTITGAGYCHITASQGGNTNYNPAASVSQYFIIARAPATITLDPSSQSFTYDGNPHPSTAAVTTTPSGLSYSVGYIDAFGSWVYGSPTLAGSYWVVAIVTDPNYQGKATGTLVINRAPQTITVSTSAPSSAPYNATFTVAASVSSGLGIAYGSSGACSNVGASYTMTSGTGTCTVTLDQGGDANHLAAPEVTETVTAQLAYQTITFDPLPNRAYGDAPFTVTATASSGLPVSFSVGGTDACTISGSTVTITGAGSCTVAASRGGNSNYAPASSVSQTFTIAKATTTTTLTSSVNPSIVGQSVTFTAKLVATPGSLTPAGTVTFLDGTTPLASGIPLDGTGAATFTTSALAAGTHSITAAYSGNANFTGSATSSPLSQQVRYTVKILSTSRLTVVLQLQDYTNTNVSSSTKTVMAECVVTYTTTMPTTCGATPVQTITKAFAFVTNYKGLGPAYSYSINPHGLTRGQQYYLLVQADGDPIWHAVQFTA